MSGPGDTPATAIFDFRDYSPGEHAYVADFTYRANAWVTYGGTTYRCIQSPSTGHQPDVSPTWWSAETKDWLTLLAYEPGVTYASGRWCLLGTVYYRSLQNANTGHQPDVSPTWWEALDPAPYSLLHDYFEPVPGFPLWWNNWLGGIAAIKASALPDHWAECESDAGGLGPAVRVDTATGDCYMALTGSDEYGGWVDLYRRKGGTATLLATFGSGAYLPQSTKLACDGRNLFVYSRVGSSGSTPGYDPFELEIAAYPWVQLGTYTDSSADALLTGKPGVWAPDGSRANYPTHSPGGGEQTSHWSYSDYDLRDPHTVHIDAGGTAVHFTLVAGIDASGAEATGSTGSVSLQGSRPVTGATATGATGSISRTASVPVTGATATGTTGSVEILVSTVLHRVRVEAGGTPAYADLVPGLDASGADGVSAAGATALSAEVPVTGAQASGATGSIAFSVHHMVSGAEATGSTGSVSISASRPVSGALARGTTGGVVWYAIAPLLAVVASDRWRPVRSWLSTHPRWRTSHGRR